MAHETPPHPGLRQAHSLTPQSSAGTSLLDASVSKDQTTLGDPKPRHPQALLQSLRLPSFTLFRLGCFHIRPMCGQSLRLPPGRSFESPSPAQAPESATAQAPDPQPPCSSRLWAVLLARSPILAQSSPPLPKRQLLREVFPELPARKRKPAPRPADPQPVRALPPALTPRGAL